MMPQGHKPTTGSAISRKSHESAHDRAAHSRPRRRDLAARKPCRIGNMHENPDFRVFRHPHRLMPRSRCRTSSRSWSNWPTARAIRGRSEEHTSELQSLMRISYAVFCLKKKKLNTNYNKTKYKNKEA